MAVATGLVTLPDVVRVVALVWDATLTLVAVILISLVLDAAGFFEWAALHVVRAARGHSRRLFLYTLVLGAAVSALFTNDGTALILTPIVYEQVKALRLPPTAVLAFVLAGGFIADATSLPFTTSNLVNILSADFFHIGFLGYAVRMVPVDIVVLAASVGLLFLLFRKDLPDPVETGFLPHPDASIRDSTLFRWAWAVLAVLLLGYLASEIFRFPVSLPAAAAAVLLLAAARRSPTVSVARTLHSGPWRVVAFALGMYIVVFGLRNAGLLDILAHLLTRFAAHGEAAGLLGTGYLALVLSAVMNNLPTVLIGSLAIHAASLPPQAATSLALANVIGCDLGPKVTPIGSLATLLWMHVLEGRGVRISWGRYCLVGIVLTVPVLLVGLLALWGVLSV